MRIAHGGGSMESILTTIYRPLTTRDNKGGTNSPSTLPVGVEPVLRSSGLAPPSFHHPERQLVRYIWW